MPQTFFSDSVESAMAAARQALGEEAVLINAGASASSEASRGAYRVVVALPEGPEEPRLEAAPPRPVEFESLRLELRSLRTALESTAAVAARSLLDRSALATTPELAPSIFRMLEAGVPAALAQSLADAAARRLALEPGARSVTQTLAARALLAELESRLAVSAGFGLPDARRRIVALAGPPGAGKTTSLAKLAMRHAVSGRRSASVLSLDVFRIGAADQLRSLSSILGLPFRLVETPGALARALEDAVDKDMIFIDTPGASPAELEWWQGWAPRLASQPGVEVQLVLPATASHRQLALWIQLSAPVNPQRLIFTHLDEAASPGAMVAAALDARLPVSFLASGQAIPEDIEPAAKPRLLELLLGRPDALGAAA